MRGGWGEITLVLDFFLPALEPGFFFALYGPGFFFERIMHIKTKKKFIVDSDLEIDTRLMSFFVKMGYKN